MKNWIQYLIYISILFLLIYLKQHRYIDIPRINSYGYLGFSIILLFVGFISTSLTWTAVLRKSKIYIDYKQSISSVGLYIFAKYIPGKVWVILGKSGYVAKKSKISIHSLSTVALNEQFLLLWTGLTIGAFGLFLIKGLNVWGGSVALCWLILTAVIFTNIFHDFTNILLIKLGKTNINIPKLSFLDVVRVIPWFILTWISWCFAFYFFARSIAGYDVPLSIGPGFALGTTLGVMSLFTPGGLGVREGILTVYLLLAGIDTQDAATIAIASRIWFLVGECLIFCLGILLDRLAKNQVPPAEPGV